MVISWLTFEKIYSYLRIHLNTYTKDLDFLKVNSLFPTDTLPLQAFGESDQLPNKMVERDGRNMEEARNLGARNLEGRNLEGRKMEENTKELYNELHRLRQENSEEWRKREESESNLSEMKRQLRREVSHHLFYKNHITQS